MKQRTFIAVAIPEAVRRGALEVARRLEPIAGDVKWTAAENLHWTLQFLGDVDELDVAEVCGAVGSATADVEPFELEVRGVGAFPSPQRPRTLWLGAGRGAAEMTSLQASIEQAVGDLGFRVEQRRYVPHLTLGRAGRGRRPRQLAIELERLRSVAAGTMVVDEVTVFASRLRRVGPQYRVLGRLPVGQP